MKDRLGQAFTLVIYPTMIISILIMTFGTILIRDIFPMLLGMDMTLGAMINTAYIMLVEMKRDCGVEADEDENNFHNVASIFKSVFIIFALSALFYVCDKPNSWTYYIYFVFMVPVVMYIIENIIVLIFDFVEHKNHIKSRRYNIQLIVYDTKYDNQRHHLNFERKDDKESIDDILYYMYSTYFPDSELKDIKYMYLGKEKYIYKYYIINDTKTNTFKFIRVNEEEF